jgi:hypothetical protein
LKIEQDDSAGGEYLRKDSPASLLIPVAAEDTSRMPNVIPIDTLPSSPIHRIVECILEKESSGEEDQ